MPRVLVVEDSPTQAAAVRMILEGAGFEVTHAPDAEAALAALRGRAFDAVLSDIVMPGPSGYELCRRVKNDPAMRDLPVILLTSLSDPMDIIQGLECGADNFLTKPCEPESLVARVKTVLENRRIRTDGRLKLGVEILFLGKRFTITSDKEQILSLLVSTFEDVVRANRELRRTQDDLAKANARLEEHACRMEGRAVASEQELRKSEEQLRQAQKLDAIGRLAGGIAHDFNNLLTVINGYVEIVLGRLPAGDPSRPDLDEVRRAGERAAGLTRQLLAFSRKQALNPRVIDLNAAVREIERMLRRLLGEDIQIRTVLDPSLGLVKADPSQIEQVVMNLSVNARDAMPTGGQLTIETANAELDETYAASREGVAAGPHVMLAVTDNGVGMDEETKSRIFEPFFTTKEKGKGTGLGLATVYGIVKQSGGHVSVYSEPGKGTTFKIYLPRVAATDEPPPARTVEAGESRGTETILLVEDEEAVRRLVCHILRSRGYAVLEAADGLSAHEIAERHAGPIHLVLSDLVMPRMGGPDLVRTIQSLRSGIRVLFMTGYAAQAVTREGGLVSGARVLGKPFTAGGLARAVREALDAPPAVSARPGSSPPT